MYIPQITTDRIRKLASEKGISLTKINETCGLSVNVISQSGKSKEGMKARNLYMIAETLDCSVDYLLGRTDEPQRINQVNTGNVGNNSNVNVNGSKEKAYFQEDETVSELIAVFRNLDFCDKAKVMSLVAELSKRKD